MNLEEEHAKRPQEMAELAQRFLDLKRWEFHESIRLLEPSASVIYDSEWCRVKLAWGGRERFGGGETMYIDYARLHAPNDEVTIVWNDQEHYCWHRISDTALPFLDGLSPKEATELREVLPAVMQQFAQSELGKSLSYQPERLTQMHAAVWGHYGQRLFELFDLRRPDLWELYSQFVREFYEINGYGSNPVFDPPLYRIC